MRKDLLSAAVAAFLLLSGDAFARQNAQGQPSQNQAQQSQQSQQAAPPASAPSSAPAAPAPSSQSTVVSPAPNEDALVAAARKAREQKKDQAGAKPARVFNNDNIPTQGGVSAGGENAAAPAAAAGDAAAAGNGSAPASSGTSAAAGEKAWRERFARLRKKMEQEQTDLDLLQRELGVLDGQYYNDPVKGMQQGYSRSDINEKTDKIEAKKKVIEADQQAISDAEEELHRAGGDPGWAR